MSLSRLPVIGKLALTVAEMVDISEIDSNPEKLAPEITKACKEWGFVHKQHC